MSLTREELKEIIKEVLKEVMIEEGIIRHSHHTQGVSTRYSINEEDGLVGPTTKYGINNQLEIEMKNLKEKLFSFIGILKGDFYSFIEQNEIKEKILVFSFIAMVLFWALFNIILIVKLAVFLKCGLWLTFAILTSVAFGLIYLYVRLTE